MAYLETATEQIYTLFDAHLDMTIDLIRRRKVNLPCETTAIGMHGWFGTCVARLLESWDGNTGWLIRTVISLKPVSDQFHTGCTDPQS